MSCFESSTFLKNPSIMNQSILIKACEKLNWKYKVEDKVLLVYEANQKTNLRREYALKVDGNRITYNSYYMKNGKELVKKLENEFYHLNISYAKETILAEFNRVGFTLLPDYNFIKNDKEVERFSMVGYSKIKEETEKKTVIQFTILNDGTIVSDSNYIPADLHELADKAMEKIDEAFGTKREEGVHIKRKEVPLKYKNKSYCTANNKIKAKN